MDFDDFGLLVGRHFTALPTLSDTQPSELQLDSSGRLIISGRYLEDSGHSSGDAGIFVMGVRNDADAVLTDANFDYSPIAVDDKGRVKVLADLDVDFDFVHAEDSPHTSGDLGSFSLGIRIDDISAANTAFLAGTEGDYQGFFTDAKGQLWVRDKDSFDKLSEIDVTLDALSKAEDSGHSSGDQGIMALAVRNDADAVLTDTDLDYSPIAVDSTGKIKISDDLEGSEAYTVTDALAAAGDGLETITALATPFVTVASLSVGAGTTAHLYGWQWACDQNAAARIVTDDTTDVIVYKADLNSSSDPSQDEHFSKEGRIEIPGAANLEIKLQIKKRNAAGGDAKGTGSMHIRTV